MNDFFIIDNDTSNKVIVKLDFPKFGRRYLRTTDFDERSQLVKSRHEATEFSTIRSIHWWFRTTDANFKLSLSELGLIYDESTYITVEHI